MKRVDYLAKIRAMIDDGITCGDYTLTTDNTLKDLKKFCDFLYRNFENHPNYEKMLPTSNQPARLYGTAKTHKFTSPDIIANEKLKFWPRPIIAQTGTYTYNAAQVTAEYVKLLVYENPYLISNTQDLPSILKAEPPLETDEEYVSYDVESLFTNILVRETTNYILAEIYDRKKLKPMCSELIFKHLLLKLTTKNTLIFNTKYYTQTMIVSWEDQFFLIST